MSQPNTAELQANQAEMAPRGAVIEYKPDADVRMRDLCETLKGCQDQKLIVIHIQGGDSEGDRYIAQKVALAREYVLLNLLGMQLYGWCNPTDHPLPISRDSAQGIEQQEGTAVMVRRLVDFYETAAHQIGRGKRRVKLAFLSGLDQYLELSEHAAGCVRSLALADLGTIRQVIVLVRSAGAAHALTAEGAAS